MSEKPKEKPKILGMTDASLKTGFGQVMDCIMSGLAQNGYECYELGWGFRFEEPLQRNGYTLLPCGDHPNGADVLGGAIMNIKPEVLITQMDTRMGIGWFPNGAGLPELLKSIPQKTQWILYPVVDGNVWDSSGSRNKWASNWTNFMKQADVVVGMTQYGQGILKANGIENARYIPHPVDTTLFKPFPEETKKQIKAQFGAQDKFVVGGVFKNILRKNPEKYLQSFILFRELMKKQGDKDIDNKTMLLLHTPPNQQARGEFNLDLHAVDYGLTIGKDIVFSQQGMQKKDMPAIYNAMDVFLALGGMESFDLPLIEAMACALPIVAFDSCTYPEILGDAGLLAESAVYPRSKYLWNKLFRATYGSYNGIEGDIPDIHSIAENIQKIYISPQLKTTLGMKASERVLKYDTPNVVKMWVDLMKELIITTEMLPDAWRQILEGTK
jgi:glycosyltransferase involved in cell wall biosynthesis